MTKCSSSHPKTILSFVLTLCLVLIWSETTIAQGRRGRAQRPATLGLDQGTIDLDTPDFTLKLVKASQTVAALEPKGADGFDFTPADQLESRASNGYHHLGDLTLRLRTGNSGQWQDYSTATARQPVTALEVSGQTLAAADLSPTLADDCPLQITRSWMLDGDKLVLSFALRNKTDQTVQIGSLGIPMIFNNMITRRTLEQAHETCSFFDPYIGQDAGYLQVTRLSGHGPALVVVPEGRTPFEAYKLLDEPTRPSQTFEGAFEWLVHTEAYASNEWQDVEPWNPATMASLNPGQTRTYGVKFLVSDEIRDIEKTLAAGGRPVAVGIPGYILPMDLNGKLFLDYPSEVTTVEVAPEGAMTWTRGDRTEHGRQSYVVHGKKWGRARLTVTYADGTKQAIHYYVIKPAAEAVADLGHFLTTEQWFDDANDPFGRSPSVISYDREVNAQVTQDSRAWIAGLGDEGGSGSYVAAAMKEFGQPDKAELAKFQQFVSETVWGGIQYNEGDNMYGVRKSLFYYGMPDYPYREDINWGSWTSWDKREAESIGRGYNYPHVAATYWAMYRLARNNTDLVTDHTWDWYLDHAYQTIKFLTNRNNRGRYAVSYVDKGLMEGTVFVRILKDLQREGWTDKAADVETRMKERADRWIQQAYPFGSEMAWDSTGQEEVYAWCKYFDHDDKALVSLNSILGYMPTVPHWGYNGCARRYWDFIYGGKLGRYERQLHHYGSGLNALPVMTEYRDHPDDYYLLRVGYGGLMGGLSNIDQEGFASVAFHSFPDTLRWDAYTGDYGPNFLGHALNTGTYIINHPEFGWQAFGGNVETRDGTVSVKTLDSLRKRVYIAPLGLYLTLDAGAFEGAQIVATGQTVKVGLAPATASTPMARLRIEQPAERPGIGTYQPAATLTEERGAFDVPLGSTTTWVELVPKS